MLPEVCCRHSQGSPQAKSWVVPLSCPEDIRHADEVSQSLRSVCANRKGLAILNSMKLTCDLWAVLLFQDLQTKW